VGIDLHIHSNASDGTLTPAQIVETAKRLGLGAVAITDHDTTEGSRVALPLARSSAVSLLSGVEISSAPPRSVPCKGSFHILGYGIDLDSRDLIQTLARLQEARKNRNPAIVECLNRLGFDITMDEIMDVVGNGQAGRPHIAQAMVIKGFVRTIDEAFERFLARGKPAYVDKYRISCREAIELIRGAGGIAVLAHPYLLSLKDPLAVEQLVVSLKKMGLQGLEVYYPEHPPQATVFYEHLAKTHHLLKTGGTDFHGAIKPEIQMGTGAGGFCVPYVLYQKLIAALGRVDP
jgi:hypothetical protein